MHYFAGRKAQSATFTISFLLYVPQFLQTRCGIMSSPHFGHLTRFITPIFQLALL